MAQVKLSVCSESFGHPNEKARFSLGSQKNREKLSDSLFHNPRKFNSGKMLGVTKNILAKSIDIQLVQHLGKVSTTNKETRMCHLSTASKYLKGV